VIKERLLKFVIKHIDKKELAQMANKVDEEKKAAIYDLYDKYGYKLENLEKFAREGNAKLFNKAVKNFLEEVHTTIIKDFGFEDLL
jgi:translation initiation factor 2 alpha subunit (eIF-2alpha)